MTENAAQPGQPEQSGQPQQPGQPQWQAPQGYPGQPGQPQLPHHQAGQAGQARQPVPPSLLSQPIQRGRPSAKTYRHRPWKLLVWLLVALVITIVIGMLGVSTATTSLGGPALMILLVGVAFFFTAIVVSFFTGALGVDSGKSAPIALVLGWVLAPFVVLIVGPLLLGLPMRFNATLWGWALVPLGIAVVAVLIGTARGRARAGY